MNANNENMNLPVHQLSAEEMNKLTGYPSYPSKDDIFNRCKVVKDVNPEDISRNMATVEDLNVVKNNNSVFEEKASGRDLDVPGSELDDNAENVGSEDEENNYYSLGGDDHTRLDEN
jgi:hypothetical protein